MNTYFRDEDEALVVTIDGTTTYHAADVSIFDVAAENGLTKADFELLS